MHFSFHYNCLAHTSHTTHILIPIPLPEIGLGKTGPAAASTTGVAGSKTGQQTGAAGSGNVVLYGDSEVRPWRLNLLKFLILPDQTDLYKPES